MISVSYADHITKLLKIGKTSEQINIDFFHVPLKIKYAQHLLRVHLGKKKKKKSKKPKLIILGLYFI